MHHSASQVAEAFSSHHGNLGSALVDLLEADLLWSESHADFTLRIGRERNVDRLLISEQVQSHFGSFMLAEILDGIIRLSNFLAVNGRKHVSALDAGVLRDQILTYEAFDLRFIRRLSLQKEHHEHDEVGKQDIEADTSECNQGTLPDWKLVKRI